MTDRFSFGQGRCKWEVFQAKINKKVWQLLGDNAPSNGTIGNFALMISKSGRRREAERERDFLQALKKHNVSHKHLVVCYVCLGCADSLYFIMDLANGNLNDFMEIYPYGRNEPEFFSGIGFSWLLRQMQGLAGALDAIHRPSGDSIGWHHDIKPQNILCYGNGRDFEFRITDWGTAEIQPKTQSHLSVEKEEQIRGSTEVGWPAYLPAETLLGPTACEPDIWSLGCVFLELLIWFNKGFEALDDDSRPDLGFRQIRYSLSKPSRCQLKRKLKNPILAKKADYNVFYTSDGGPMKYVEMAIDSLDADKDVQCTRVGDLVRTMIVANPGKRPTAQHICDELGRALVRLAEQNPDISAT